MHEAMGAVERNPRWILFPALTFAGFVSAIFNAFIWFPTGRAFVVLASLSFGLALGAVLWFYGLIRTWRTLAGVTAVTLAAHLLAMYTALHWAQPEVPSDAYVEASVLGRIRPELVFISFGVGLVVYVVFLVLTKPRCKTGWAVGIALACASLEAATIAAVDGTQRGGWIDVVTPFWWHPCLSFFLATALSAKGLLPFSHIPGQDRPSPSSSGRLIGFGILLAFWGITGTWVFGVDVREGNGIHQLQERSKAEKAKSLAEAPRFEDLPTSTAKPLDEVLLLKEVNGWQPAFSNFRDYPAQKDLGEMNAPFPHRRTYSVTYGSAAAAQAPSGVTVNVTVYPNAQWAKYEVRNTPAAYEFIDHEDSIRLLKRFGNKVFQDGPMYFVWNSDENVIYLYCEGVMPDVMDEFLNCLFGLTILKAAATNPVPAPSLQ